MDRTHPRSAQVAQLRGHVGITDHPTDGSEWQKARSLLHRKSSKRWFGKTFASGVSCGRSCMGTHDTSGSSTIVLKPPYGRNLNHLARREARTFGIRVAMSVVRGSEVSKRELAVAGIVGRRLVGEKSVFGDGMS